MLQRLVSELIQRSGLSPWLFVAALLGWSFWLFYALHRPINKPIIIGTLSLPILLGMFLGIKMMNFDPMVMFLSIGYLSAFLGVIVRRAIAHKMHVSLECGFVSTFLALIGVFIISGI